MAKTLRTTDHPQFFNKNAEIDANEYDTTLIEIVEEINKAQGLSVIPPYDSTLQYSKDAFVSHNYKIWRFVSDTPATNIEPGTDELFWVESSAIEFLTLVNFIVVSKATIYTLFINDLLIKGRFYFITSAQITAGGVDGFILYATAKNKFANLGYVQAFVPDFQVVGDYSGVDSFSAQLGSWETTKGSLDYDNLSGVFQVGETITGDVSGATAVIVSDIAGTLTLKDIVGTFQNDEEIEGGISLATADVDGVVTYTFNPQTGDVVIWNGQHWRKKTTAITSTSPDADGTNYEPLEFNTGNGYIVEVDTIFIKYFTAAGQLIIETLRRLDRRGNDIGRNSVWEWGSDDITGNRTSAGANVTTQNFYGTMQNCTFEGDDTFDFTVDTGSYVGQIFGINGGGNTFESVEFTLNADGTSATINGGAPFVPANPSAGVYVITIPTAKMLIYLQMNAVGDFGWSSGSGLDDGVKASCARVSTNGINAAVSLAYSIFCESDFDNGFRGRVVNIQPTSFDITFIKVGSGLAITGQAQLIEG